MMEEQTTKDDEEAEDDHEDNSELLSHQIQDLLGSFYVTCHVIFHLDSIIGCILSVLYTLLYWKFGEYLAVNMNLTIISMTIIFPISQGIGMAFKRREAALMLLGDLLGNLQSVYGALHYWKIKDPAGKWIALIDAYSDEEGNALKYRNAYNSFFKNLENFFHSPRTGRARFHLEPCGGKVEENVVKERQRKHDLKVQVFFNQTQSFVQNLKRKGLPGGEAHRLDSYLSKAVIAWKKLVNIKEYRTPQAFRSFARVYVLCVGALYGPYFLMLVHGSSDEEDNIGLALAFACVFQLAMSGLLSVMLGLEDPFFRQGGRGKWDSINVEKICDQEKMRLDEIEKMKADPLVVFDNQSNI